MIQIPDKMFPKLFQKFATLGVAEDAQNGTGLGLYISNAVVDAHHGTLAGLNNKEGGATFTLILPTKPTVGHDNHDDQQTMKLKSTQTQAFDNTNHYLETRASTISTEVNQHRSQERLRENIVSSQLNPFK